VSIATVTNVILFRTGVYNLLSGMAILLPRFGQTP